MHTILKILESSDLLYKQGKLKCRYGNVCVYAFRHSWDQIRGYIWYNVTSRHCYICFLGTKSRQDLRYDLKFRLLAHASIKGRIHSGFWKLYGDCFSSLNTVYQALVKQHEIKNITLIGHSMGASLAQFHSIYLAGQSIPVDVWLYCLPRTGDRNFNKWYVDYVYCKLKQLKIVNNRLDPITLLPPKIFGYRTLPIKATEIVRFHRNPHIIRHLIRDGHLIKN